MSLYKIYKIRKHKTQERKFKEFGRIVKKRIERERDLRKEKKGTKKGKERESCLCCKRYI